MKRAAPLLAGLLVSGPAAAGDGLAAEYPKDTGLAQDKAVPFHDVPGDELDLGVEPAVVCAGDLTTARVRGCPSSVGSNPTHLLDAAVRRNTGRVGNPRRGAG